MIRKEEFLADLYSFCFNWLDNEPEFSGFDAGQLAVVIEKLAQHAIEQEESTP